MYKKIESKWVKHLDFILLDLLGFQVAYRLSYLFLLWYAESPNASFYLNQACILFILQAAVCLIKSGEDVRAVDSRNSRVLHNNYQKTDFYNN